ncbi:CPBP family intramembrane glutamic endopeptidase [Clostridium vincentii]|uniref:CAAX amino terminal protease self-immunity n=1 Tax=Clostridium vincentii TaxID=52704 RepID=A0A2T0B7Y0_9CLOT|nr:type II CAAX endopeptidase family protein [Clostridium vincentii]PRR79972.1 CAAX amino terminal protease self- immunity [Clostridium vincentii]
MKKVTKANLYFLILLLIEIIGPYGMREIYIATGVRDFRVVQAVSSIVLILLPAIIYILVTKGKFKQILRLNKLSFKNIMLTIIIAIICTPLSWCLSMIGVMFFENNIGAFMTEVSTSTPLIVMVLLMAVMPAIIEEISLRGVVLWGYNGQSKVKAALFTGVFFGILHLDGHQFLGAAVLGFVMAYVVRVTNSIFSSMIIHFIINGSSVMILAKSLSMTNSEEAIERAQSLDITQISLDIKMMIIMGVTVIGICLFGLIFKLIQEMEKKNLYTTPEMEERAEVKSLEKGGLINIPLLLIIIVYLLVMVLKI